MKYRINEIFLSIQGEGFNAGRLAVFVRFAGCNLACKFCDTNHESYSEMTAEDIVARIEELTPNKQALIVFTGGEPLMQLNEEEELAQGYERAIETNGILPIPEWVQDNVWITISPKTMLPKDKYMQASELKCLCGLLPSHYMKELSDNFHRRLYIQPIERQGQYNIEECLDFIKENPQWRLSTQVHKFLGIR